MHPLATANIETFSNYDSPDLQLQIKQTKEIVERIQFKSFAPLNDFQILLNAVSIYAPLLWHC